MAGLDRVTQACAFAIDGWAIRGGGPRPTLHQSEPSGGTASCREERASLEVRDQGGGSKSPLLAISSERQAFRKSFFAAGVVYRSAYSGSFSSNFDDRAAGGPVVFPPPAFHVGLLHSRGPRPYHALRERFDRGLAHHGVWYHNRSASAVPGFCKSGSSAAMILLRRLSVSARRTSGPSRPPSPRPKTAANRIRFDLARLRPTGCVDRHEAPSAYR
jgi:hypothetical protein